MAEYEKRAMTYEEDKYTFSQSPQIASQTGLIGYLRADMDSDGNGFFSNWFDWRKDLKTDEFKKELDEIINSLREEGDILHNRGALAVYCRNTPQARMNSEQEYYGVRVDTDKYAYLIRLNPNKGEYNMYCYCYRRDWLDDHIRQARRGIRFITPHYEEKFRIEDGEKIRIILSDGEQFERGCRYIDDYHVEVGEMIFHICEFAERMKQNGSKVIPLRSDLPDCCYSVNKVTGEIIILKKGEKGFYQTDIPTKGREESRELADFQNGKLGVTKAQEAAMYWGSVYGFDTSGADPKQYDADGKMLKPVRKDRGDAR
ncbi:MAG: hypothetical protein IJK33_05315 [Clostridia bacterium]|nr:hypothetical protein [Clostridia bacterium]